MPQPKPPTCCNCHLVCGDAVKVSPMFVDDDAHTQDNPSYKCWCPTCFVSKRAPMEPERFGRSIVAVRCSACGWTSVASGRLACPRCGCIRVRPMHGQAIAATMR